MHVNLSAYECRVIGCLIEKQIATPEHYPLSLNALVNAVNQKSNRDPELSLSESEVQAVVDGLVRKSLVSEHSGYGSRVTKYQHRFCNTEYGQWRFSPRELAVLCELLLRGAQTPGELRTRAGRLAAFGDVSDAQATLDALLKREDGPFVVRLAREPGRRESRYAHLFSGEIEGATEDEGQSDVSCAALPPAYVDGSSGPPSAMAALKQRVALLEAEVAALRERLDALTPPAA